MPAQEDTYRNQKGLHVVFAVSSILMTVSILWMIAADHFREWKRMQIDFMDLDAKLSERESLLATDQELDDLRAKLEAAEAAAAAESEAARAELTQVAGPLEKTFQELNFKRADRDSWNSFYDIYLHLGWLDKAEAIRADLDKLELEIVDLQGRFEGYEETQKQAKSRLEKAREEAIKLEKQIAEKEKEKERVERKKWSWGARLRSAPVLDAFSSATKIEQVMLADLPINYAFRGVPRFDRCTTCHKAIDKVTRKGAPQFDAQAVDELSTSPHKRAFATHSHPELFAGPASPHPREKFGCTICHAGQGSGTSFLFASHTPDSLEKEHEWKERYGWYEIHHWPHKMYRARFMASGCVKCHPHVVDLEPASQKSAAVAKLLNGYNIVRQYGCFGCHDITGYKKGLLIGPDLRVEPQTPQELAKAMLDTNVPPGTMRKVGPSLRHIAQKTTDDWTFRWIKLPRGFRPTTRMPQFYGLANNTGETKLRESHIFEDVDISDVELAAIVYYLYSQSTDAALVDIPQGVAVDPANGDQTKRGFQRFIERGCLACHSHKEVKNSDYPQANADFGPDLSNIAEKLKTEDGQPNVKWLFNWLKDPTAYHATSFMPNLQLTDEEAADIAAWLLSAQGEWASKPERPDSLNEDLLDEVIGLFLRKSMTLKEADDVLARGLPADKVKDQKGDEKLLAVGEGETLPDKKLLYLGKKTIGRLGCFGCHDIPGFETAKPIGTELANWGQKAAIDPDKLDFAHIVEYLEHETPAAEQESPDFHLFLEAMEHGKGEAFLWGKLREPRSYDYEKPLKAWDDKLRMPRFPFADRPEDVEAVMTFVLGLVADDGIPQHMRSVPKAGPKFAKIDGAKALAKYNCAGCHMTETPQFAFDLSKLSEDQLPDAAHPTDFPHTVDDQKAMNRAGQADGSRLVTIHGMLNNTEAGLDRVPRIPDELPDDSGELYIDLWQPTVLDGKQYYIGDRFGVPMDALDKSKSRPAKGGQFAELLVSHLMKQRKRTDEAWNQVPPPLVREGMKAQPAWLHQFLLDPIAIRPAVLLRMPKFNMSSSEAAALAAYFAAVDGVEYPYAQIEQRDSAYLAQREREHENYLSDGWRLMTVRPEAGSTASLCINCHNLAGDITVSGGKPEERGPDLWLSPDRVRPDWLRQWITAPKRLLPYTAMPSNFPAGQALYQDKFAGPSPEQITAVRDTIMNYHRVQQDLAKQRARATTTGGGN